MAFVTEIMTFSYGDVRCHLAEREADAATGNHAIATLHHKDAQPHQYGAVKFFLHSPAEIGAFRALSEALAAQDVVEGVGS